MVAMAHHRSSKFLEDATLQRLRKKIRHHLISGTIHNIDFSRLHPIMYKEEPNIYMPQILSTRIPPIYFHPNSAFIVLEQ